MQCGGKRTDHDRIEKLVHLILTDHNHRTHHSADFPTYGGIEIGKVDGVSLLEKPPLIETVTANANSKTTITHHLCENLIGISL